MDSARARGLCDAQRCRLDEWATAQGVDLKSKLLFLSLPPDLREKVRDKGKLHTSINPSSLLMSRIREVYAGHIPMDAQAHEEWQSKAGARFRSYQPQPTKPIIVVTVRGESHREGQCHQHGTTGKIGTFINNLESYRKYLIEPLEQEGFQVLCFGDLRSSDTGEEQALEAFQRVFGKRFVDCRVQTEMLGFNQVSSVMSSWDAIQHQLTLRKQGDEIKGIFYVRADCTLKKKGLETWPTTDRMCFLWKTWSQKFGEGINDIMWYVPQHLGKDFRKTLSEATEQVSLHWLVQVDRLQDHVWTMFDFYHPSNTIKSGNPYYDISARIGAYPDEGKFIHYLLAQDPNAPGKIAADAMTATERQAEWNRKVKLTMEAWYTEAEHESILAKDLWQGPRGMKMFLWKTYWNRAFPEDMVDWYKPYKGILKSLRASPYVDADSENIWWRSSHGTFCSQQEPCQVCERTWTKLPQQSCAACTRLCCIMCIDTCVDVALCKECFQYEAIEKEEMEEVETPWRHSGPKQEVKEEEVKPPWRHSGQEVKEEVEPPWRQHTTSASRPSSSSSSKPPSPVIKVMKPEQPDHPPPGWKKRKFL